MAFAITLEDVRRALALPEFDSHKAQARMAPHPRPLRRSDLPGSPRLAGVLLLLFPDSSDGALHFALMRRTEYPGVHSGQVSMPGGRREGEESLDQTALRETQEELGVPADQVRLLGPLTMLYVPPSDFEIYPVVGHVEARPIWQPDPQEVAEVLDVPLSLLLDDDMKGRETIERLGVHYEIGYYRVGPHKVWGATAAMLSEFEMRLRATLLQASTRQQV